MPWKTQLSTGCGFVFSDGSPLHYAAIESNRELNKSFKVIALLLLIFGPNLIMIFLLV